MRRTSLSLIVASLLSIAAPLHALTVPADFADERVFAGLAGIFDVQFSDDGRMFLSEWRRGHLRIATWNAADGTWTMLPEPFHELATPDSPLHGTGMYDSSGAKVRGEKARRGTFRGFAFDPDFAVNGYIYVTYMHEDERSGYRISRIQASAADPNVSTGEETVLLRCPFFAGRDGQPDAHNGGAVGIGPDGKLYVAFGDGWNTDTPQDMNAFGGKVVRLDLDGSIPTDNPFYSSASGDYRAICALGLRNPVGMSRHPVSGALYISSYQGSGKADHFRLRKGANYGHGNGSGPGTPTGEWINTDFNDFSGATDTAWYPPGGGWPGAYEGNCFASNWMGDGGIVRISGGESSPVREVFADDISYVVGSSRIQATAVAFGPDGHLYYAVREYGEYTDLRRIRHAASDSGDPSISIAVDHASVPEGSSTPLRIQRSGDASMALEVNIALTGSAGVDDHDLHAGSIRLDAGQGEATVTLGIVDDALHEGEETLTVHLQNGSGYRIGSPAQVSIAIPASDTPLRDPDAPEGVEAGLVYEYFHLSSPSGVAAMDGLTPRASGTVTNIDLGPADRDDGFGFRFLGYFEVTEDGTYDFATTSDDGSTLRIGSTLVVDNDGAHSLQTVTGSIGLKAGLHVLALAFFEASGGEELRVQYRGPGDAEPQDLPDSLLWHVPPGAPYGLEDRGSIAAFLDGAFPVSPTGSLPATLSATGAFTDLSALTPRDGVLPFMVLAPLWSDHALKSRWIALPDGASVGFAATGQWAFPSGTVTIKHFELPLDETDPGSTARLETRFLVKNGAESWYGVTYRWRADGSDADLVAAEGDAADFTVETAAGGNRIQTWTFPSRSGCMECHNSTAGFSLGLNTRQLNGDATYPATGIADNQLRTWNHIGMFDVPVDERAIPGYHRLVAADEGSAGLQHRFRSYIDANCAQCHQPDGPGHGGFDARYDTASELQGIVDGTVQHDLGIEGVRLIKPRDPWRSMMLHRAELRDGVEQMPTLGSNEVDPVGMAMIRAYIDSLGGDPALAPPTLDPEGGGSNAPLTVTVDHPDGSAVLRYTTDGRVPDSSDPLFPSVGLTLTADTVLRAMLLTYQAGVTSRQKRT